MTRFRWLGPAAVLALSLVVMGGCDSGVTEARTPPAAPTLSTVSAEDTATIADLLEPVIGDVESISIRSQEASRFVAEISADLSVPEAALEDTATVDGVAFMLFDILQRSAGPDAQINVSISAIVSAPGSMTARERESRSYHWPLGPSHTYTVAMTRADFIYVVHGTTPLHEDGSGCTGTGYPVGYFSGINEARVTAAADGDVPELEPSAVFGPPRENGATRNGLTFGFDLPEALDAYRAGVEYTANGWLAYSGRAPDGRLLSDMTLPLPYGTPLEFVLRDVATGTETVWRSGEAPAKELALKPKSGLEQDIDFAFPHAGRFEVFLRMAGGPNSARTRGIWINVGGASQ